MNLGLHTELTEHASVDSLDEYTGHLPDDIELGSDSYVIRV